MATLLDCRLVLNVQIVLSALPVLQPVVSFILLDWLDLVQTPVRLANFLHWHKMVAVSAKRAAGPT